MNKYGAKCGNTLEDTLTIAVVYAAGVVASVAAAAAVTTGLLSRKPAIPLQPLLL